MKNKCLLVIFSIFLGIVAGRVEFDLYEKKPTYSISKAKKRITNSVNEPWHYDTVALYKFLNGEYYGLVNVGSPAQTFKVLFATTFADTYLPSSHCPWTEIVCRLHNRYDSTKSSSYIPNGEFVNLSNDELSLAGFLSTDTFHLPHVKVTNHTFLEATHISLRPFIGYRADGIIGLAYKDASTLNIPTFFHNMIYQNVAQEHVFTFYMNRDETTARAGKIILGGKQRTHVKNDTLTTLNLLEKKLWKVQIDSIFAMKHKTSYPIGEKCIAIFDSSVNVISGPMKEITKLNYMLNAVYIPEINRYTVSCRDYAKLPTIHFILNGDEFVIESKYYVQHAVLGSIEVCLSPFVPKDNTQIWELGGAFMMEFYTEFDMDDNVIRIGQTVF